MECIIDKAHDGFLLRNYIINVCNISHKLLTRLKEKDNGIILNGKRVTVRAVLREGDILILNTDDEEDSNILPIKAAVMPEILYEDEDMMVLNKPPLMPTHPSHGHYEDTLANSVAYIFSSRGETRKFRAITRLDKNTSGAVIIAKNSRSAAILSKMMQNVKIEKTYIAICEGLTPKSFTVNKIIKREKESIITRVVCESNEGQYALTHFEKLYEHNGHSVLSVTPMTGRTHQIRVHLAYAGYPILGDELYGNVSEEITRQALHAKTLKLTFPSGETMTFDAPLFDDMAKFVPIKI